MSHVLGDGQARLLGPFAQLGELLGRDPHGRDDRRAGVDRLAHLSLHAPVALSATLVNLGDDCARLPAAKHAQSERGRARVDGDARETNVTGDRRAFGRKNRLLDTVGRASLRFGRVHVMTIHLHMQTSIKKITATAFSGASVLRPSLVDRFHNRNSDSFDNPTFGHSHVGKLKSSKKVLDTRLGVMAY